MSKMISFRCPPDLWAVLAAVIDGYGDQSLSAVIVQALRQHFQLPSAPLQILAPSASDAHLFDAIAAWNGRIAQAGYSDVSDEADPDAAQVLPTLTVFDRVDGRPMVPVPAPPTAS